MWTSALIAALICSGRFGQTVIICCNSVSFSAMLFVPELPDFGSFWAVVVFDFSVSSLFLVACEFWVTGSSPVAPIHKRGYFLFDFSGLGR